MLWRVQLAERVFDPAGIRRVETARVYQKRGIIEMNIKKICEIVLYVMLALLVLSLVACARTPDVSETIAENAINSVTAVEQGLAEECKTEAIRTQLTVVKSEIRTITKSCQAEKDEITRDKLKWKVSFWILIGVIAAYIARKLTR